VTDILVKMKFGSHLYGTDTPESDLDFKGVFMPSPEEIYLGRIPKSHHHTTKAGSDARNTAADVDTESYSLHYFLELAVEGQTVALDMLHAPADMVLVTSPLWQTIVQHRHRFYTRSLQAFIGYARRQAAKYGIKGSRLNATASVIDILRQHSREDRLTTVWEKLPLGEHLKMLDLNPHGLRQYQVCGKAIQESAAVGYALDILERFYAEYGRRAQLAAENKGIDWKAVSHAMRAAIQTKHILTQGTIVFPLPEAALLLKIKQGQLDYTTVVAPMLEDMMSEVEELSAASALPEKADRRWWDDFLLRAVEDHLWRYSPEKAWRHCSTP